MTTHNKSWIAAQRSAEKRETTIVPCAPRTCDGGCGRVLHGSAYTRDAVLLYCTQCAERKFLPGWYLIPVVKATLTAPRPLDRTGEANFGGVADGAQRVIDAQLAADGERYQFSAGRAVKK